MRDYFAEYNDKLTTPENAVAGLKDGDTVIPGMASAEPIALLAAIADRARRGELKKLKVYFLRALDNAAKTILAPDLCDCIQTYSWFAGSADRSLISVGLDYYVPNHFHQVPRFVQDFMEVDCTVTGVSPMDKSGYFSFGAANDYTSTAARCSKKLIVEVNRKMPRVFGGSLLHISEVDAIVEHDADLAEVIPPEPTPEDDRIGRYIADMIPDGATIQLGIGGVPNAVARCLAGHRDLGVHSEVLGPGIVDLIEKGVITGRKKVLHPFKCVFTAAHGTRRMYEFMDDNSSMESYPVSYVNDPGVIARNNDMISINAVLEVDLLGQCNAEYLDGSQFSGTGGQLDFVRGAYNARGGKSILAFHSTAAKGKISRVVARFHEGTIITTPRIDTHYLVTEYGGVNLKGKSTRERALDIISIAHPSFRDQLLRQAEDMYLL
ncbi:MAG: acetyl-CoA hydrolase/transferase family protein [Dehalococcoidia bacterium]|nr:MAG: acetyl-CoA hydrolase/transferase family protein [Dehalococcoidia bacterium]